MAPTITVVVPTYNERQTLPLLVRQVLARQGYRVLVADDQSPDGTGDIADALATEFPGRVEVLHRTGKRGLGRAYVDGMTRAIEQGADLICQMDADLSHDPRFLPDMAAAAERFDVVVGSRYLHGVSVVNWPLRRLVLSSFANFYVRTITGLNLRDCTSGFRCWRRETLERLHLAGFVSDGYSFQVETVFKAARLGCRVGEVPIVFVERHDGASKLSNGVVFESMVLPWRLILRHGRAGR